MFLMCEEEELFYFFLNYVKQFYFCLLCNDLETCVYCWNYK